MTDSERLASIRDRLAAIAPARWALAHDADGAFVEAHGPMGELLPVARFHPGASTDEMAFCAEAPETVTWLVGLVDRATRRIRELTGQASTAGKPAKPDKDYAAEAAMKCAEPAFKRFLAERHGLDSPATDERVAQHLRGILGVTSRRELNHADAAASRWVQLRGEFEAWRRAG